MQEEPVRGSKAKSNVILRAETITKLRSAADSAFTNVSPIDLSPRLWLNAIATKLGFRSEATDIRRRETRFRLRLNDRRFSFIGQNSLVEKSHRKAIKRSNSFCGFWKAYLAKPQL